MSPENPLLRRSEDVKKYMASYGGKLHVVLQSESLNPCLVLLAWDMVPDAVPLPFPLVRFPSLKNKKRR